MRSGSGPLPRICGNTVAPVWSWRGGSRRRSVHALAHAMNDALGNVGHTVVYTAPVAARPVDQPVSLRALVEDMAAGHVQLLLILGG